MQSPTTIVNDALSQIGAKSISDIDSVSDTTAVLCKKYYDQCWQEVLEEHIWKECKKRATPSAGTVEVYDFYDYSFTYPSDCVLLVKVLDVNGSEITENCDIRGSEIYTNEDTLYIEYVSSAGILLESYGIAPTLVPVYVQHVVALLIASKIAFRITQNESLMRTMYQEYMLYLEQAKIKNGRKQSYGGEAYWGDR
jgi:hypothetical protein